MCPKVACKLSEMIQLGSSNVSDEENSSFADTEQDKQDSKGKEGEWGQNCLVSAKNTKSYKVTGVRGRSCQPVPWTHINSVTSCKTVVINPDPPSEQSKFDRILTHMRR